MVLPSGIIRCPVTGQTLTATDGGLVNDEGYVYPVVDGIPVLIADHLSVFSAKEIAERRYVEESTSRLRSLARWAVPSRTEAIGAAGRYAQFARTLKAGATGEAPRVLVIGGGQLGQGADSLMQAELEIVESDVYISPRVDVVCDGHNLPFADESFDGIVLQAVLEHVADPLQVVSEVHRVLRTDGLVYAETPFLQAVHEGAFDFTRWTELGHRRLFRMFTEVDRGVVAGPATVLVWSIAYFARSIPSRGSRLALVLEKVATVVFFWLKYLDRVLISHPGASDGASGVFFLGRKSEAPIPDAEILASYRGAVGRPTRRHSS